MYCWKINIQLKFDLITTYLTFAEHLTSKSLSIKEEEKTVFLSVKKRLGDAKQ
jgi:hypothetical protein